ncbi:MAG: cation-translocating P-type ATPase, partial [Thermodesulfobacteriota bacterium]
RLAVPIVRVRREGRIRELPARELVAGDVVLLEAGNLVPADLRLLESANLRAQEAALTGESDSVEKSTAEIRAAGELALGDRRNMAYMGTTVTYGRGAGVVVATGMRTELGRIAHLLQAAPSEPTPLQRRLDQVGRTLAALRVAIAGAISAVGLVRGEALVDVFLTGVSVAVAVVPEGLPAVVTITLALGARRMLARNALIRKLPAVETLGSVTTICSDKTGTLTENRMTVTVLDVAGHRIDLEEETTAQGRARLDLRSPAHDAPEGSLALLLIGGALCNDARLASDRDGDGDGLLHAVGDPTEGALVVAAAKVGLVKDELDASKPRVAEIPFDSERKRMTTVHDLGSSRQGAVRELVTALCPSAARLAVTKGSVDGLLELSSHVWVDGRLEPLDEGYRARIERAVHDLAANGMRVLGVAMRPLEPLPAVLDASAVERELTFVGLAGIIDPPRAEARDAVARCKQAGIRPVMITGDHPLTALFIARELGIADAGARGVTGADLAATGDAELDRMVESVPVFARVSPEHKLRIVEALKRRGHVVAMTGDGVNDAPALKSADIGVAMGITGSDVSKEAANMVLRDDDFATIVAAVEEGRVIFDNLRKFVRFSLAGNVGKVVVMLLGVLVGMPTPLLPLQLLWLNLLTDGLLGIGLGVEPAERDVMRRKPFPPGAGMFGGGGVAQIAGMGSLIAAISVTLGAVHFLAGNPDWQTMMFTTLAFCQVWQALGTRSGADSLLHAGLGSNKPMLALSAAVVALQLGAVYLPVLRDFLRTSPLAPADLLTCVAASSLVLAYAELEKVWLGRRTAVSVRDVARVW